MVVRPLTRFASADLSAIVVISPAPSLHQPTQRRGGMGMFLVCSLLLLGSPSIRCRHGLLLLTRPKTKIWQHQGEPRFDQML